jgi:hypothetical protein
MAKKEVSKKTMNLDNRVLDNVKLVYGGIHGVTVSFSDVDDKQGINYKNKYSNVKFGAPASGDLVNAFGSLRSDLLDICGYPLEGTDRELLMSQVEVTGISFVNEKGFVITGTLGVLVNKSITLNTPLIQGEEDYPGYGDITEKIRVLYAEVKEYLNGNKRLTSDQMVEELSKLNAIKGFDKESFMLLSDEERLQMSIDFAEEAGCMVIRNDEMSLDSKSSEKIVEKYTPAANKLVEKIDSTPVVKVEEELIEEEGEDFPI